MKMLKCIGIFAIFVTFGYLLASGANIIPDVESFFDEREVEGHNVILITFEATRADHIPCYGYGHPRSTSPFICELAEESGVLFENAYSQGIWTPPSVPSMLTSLPPNAVGLDDWSESMPTEPDTVADVLQSENYETVNNMDIANFDQGFEETLPTMPPYGLTLENRSNFFLWLHYFDKAHHPYTPRDEFRKWDDIPLTTEEIKNTYTREDGGQGQREEFKEKYGVDEVIKMYDQEILEADRRVENIVDRLKELDMYDESIIIISADHGEAFWGHSDERHDEAYLRGSRVPLIMRFPGDEYAGTVVEQSVRLVDIVPTIYEYLDIDDAPYTQGESLLDAIEGESLDLPAYVSHSHGQRPEKLFWDIIYGDCKYRLHNIEEVCLENKSPRENEALLNQEYLSEGVNESEVKDKLRSKLCDIYLEGYLMFSSIHTPYLDDETEGLLREMGYLG